MESSTPSPILQIAKLQNVTRNSNFYEGRLSIRLKLLQHSHGYGKKITYCTLQIQVVPTVGVKYMKSKERMLTSYWQVAGNMDCNVHYPKRNVAGKQCSDKG